MMLSCRTHRCTPYFTTRFKADSCRSETGSRDGCHCAATSGPASRQVRAPSSEFRTLYVVTDGVLGVRTPDGQLSTVIPSESGPLRAAVCQFFHDEAGHPGVQRTRQAVGRYLYWPEMSRFVSRFVSSCAACQAAKGSNCRPAGFAEPRILKSLQVNGLLISWTCPGQQMPITLCLCELSESLN